MGPSTPNQHWIVKMAWFMWFTLVYRPPFGQLLLLCTTESSDVCFSCRSHQWVWFSTLFLLARPSSLSILITFWAISWNSYQLACPHANRSTQILTCSWAICSIHTAQLALLYLHPSSHKESPSIFLSYSYHSCSQHNPFPYIKHFVLACLTITEFLLSFFLTPKRMKRLPSTLTSFHTH